MSGAVAQTAHALVVSPTQVANGAYVAVTQNPATGETMVWDGQVWRPLASGTVDRTFVGQLSRSGAKAAARAVGSGTEGGTAVSEALLGSDMAARVPTFAARFSAIGSAALLGWTIGGAVCSELSFCGGDDGPVHVVLTIPPKRENDLPWQRMLNHPAVAVAGTFAVGPTGEYVYSEYVEPTYRICGEYGYTAGVCDAGTLPKYGMLDDGSRVMVVARDITFTARQPIELYNWEGETICREFQHQLAFDPAYDGGGWYEADLETMVLGPGLDPGCGSPGGRYVVAAQPSPPFDSDSWKHGQLWAPHIWVRNTPTIAQATAGVRAEIVPESALPARTDAHPHAETDVSPRSAPLRSLFRSPAAVAAVAATAAPSDWDAITSSTPVPAPEGLQAPEHADEFEFEWEATGSANRMVVAEGESVRVGVAANREFTPGYALRLADGRGWGQPNRSCSLASEWTSCTATVFPTGGADGRPTWIDAQVVEADTETVVASSRIAIRVVAPPDWVMHLQALRRTVPVGQTTTATATLRDALPGNLTARWILPDGAVVAAGCDGTRCTSPPVGAGVVRIEVVDAVGTVLDAASATVDAVDAATLTPEGLSTGQVAPPLAAAMAAEGVGACEPLLFTGGPSRDGDSAPDSYETCQSAVANGLSAGLAPTEIASNTLLALGGLGLNTVVLADTLAIGLHEYSDAAPGVTPHSTDPRTVPLPRDQAPPLVDALGPSGNDQLFDDLASSSAQPEPTVLDRAAQRCRSMVTRLDLTGLTIDQATNPCRNLPVYMPGGEIPQATQHRLDAITGNPARALLHAWPGRPQRPAVGPKRDWYVGVDPCIKPYPRGPDEQEQNCDEFPNWSTLEGGPGASLRVINGNENSSEGTSLRHFVAQDRCLLSASLAKGEAFLVVPMPEATRTTWTCR